MSVKQRPKTSQRKTQRTKQKTGQRKASNVRVLYPKKKTRTKLNYGRIILLVLAIYFVIWTIYPITYRMEKADELKNLKGQLTGIQKKNKQLKKDVDFLSSDEYVEQKARALGLSKPDEEVVVVIPPNAKKPLKNDEQGAEKKEQKEPTNTLWEKFTGFFSSILSNK